MIQSTNPAALFAEYTKMFAQLNLPGVDIASLMESQRKDIEALANANKTALAGFQSLGFKQAEIFRSAMTELRSMIPQVAALSGGKPTSDAAEVVQQTLHRALSDMQELAAQAMRTQTETFAAVTKRVQERTEECRSFLSPKR